MVRNILAAENALAGVNLYLYNPTATPDRRVIYRTPGAAQPPLIADLLAGAHVQTRTTFIDQSIPTIVTPAQPLTLVRWSLFATTTLIVGLTMTSMIAGYFVLSLRRTRELEALTEQLVATTAALNEHAAAIAHVSRHDTLTGMPNRLLFGDRMHDAIAAFEHGIPFTLLYLDLDRFKSVNDTLGHGAGDRLLCAVAERIAGCVRACDTAARIGGDEFAVILPDMADVAFVEAVSSRLIASLSAPFMLDDQPTSIGVSIGAAMATPGVSAESIMAQADLAMYEAKRCPQSAFHLAGGFGNTSYSGSRT
jgi:diguanylate cyclase (GGDEF)-like protein